MARILALPRNNADDSEDDMSIGSSHGSDPFESSDEEDDNRRAQVVTPPPPRFVTRSTVVIRPNGRSFDVDMRYGTIQVSKIVHNDSDSENDIEMPS